MRSKDLTGLRFGRWTVLSRGPSLAPTHGHGTRVQWLCRCDCEAEHLVTASNLTSGYSTACRRCGTATHRDIGSPEYKAWVAMKSRCYGQSNIGYQFYGGRGIVVCERWLHSYENFLADMGRRPGLDYSLDRIDSNGNYSPANCRWATRSQQDNNRRSNRLLTFDGRTQTIAQWAAETHLRKECILYRLDAGWPIRDALLQPSHRGPSLKQRPNLALLPL
jgi:hypothetical protein